MPKVNIQAHSKYSAQETYLKVKNLLDNDKDLKKLDPKYSCEFDDSNLSGVAKSSLFKASMTIDEKGDQVSVEIVVDLPFHLALAKGMVKKTLQKKLDTEIG